MLDRWFLAHPRATGETYFAHQRMALAFSARLFTVAAACFVHALVPALFQSTASRAVALLHDRMIVNRNKTSEGANACQAHSTPAPVARERGARAGRIP